MKIRYGISRRVCVENGARIRFKYVPENHATEVPDNWTMRQILDELAIRHPDCSVQGYAQVDEPADGAVRA